MVCAFFIHLVMLKIGHRGAKGYAAENTLASFEKAINLNVDGIELDVHVSLDGEVMVIHDETIDRTTTSTGLVKNLSSTTLKSYGIPTLMEVLNLINNKLLVNIELKSNNSVEKVIDIINFYVSEKKWNSENFIISSFNWELLLKVKTLNKNIKIGVLTEEKLQSAIAFAKENNAFSINPYFKLLNIENVQIMQKEGFQVHTWTVNSFEDITFVKKMKVDAIISDFPDRI